MQKAKDILHRLLFLGNGKKGAYISGILLNMIYNVASAIPFWGAYRVISELLLSTLNNRAISQQIVMQAVILSAISVTVSIIATIISSYVCHKIAFQSIFNIRMRVVNHFGKISFRHLDMMRTGEIQKSLDENMSEIEKFMSHNFPNMLGAVAVCITMIALLFTVNVPMAIAVLIAVGIAFLIQNYIYGKGKTQELISNVNIAISNMNGSFSEFIKGIKDEKIFGDIDAQTNEVAKSIQGFRDLMNKEIKLKNPFVNAYKVIIMCLAAVVILVGGVLIHMNPGNTDLFLSIIFFLIVVPGLYGSMIEVIDMSLELKTVEVRLWQIDGLLEIEAMVQSRGNKVPDSYDIAFQNVAFSYQDKQETHREMVIKDVSFQIPNGKMTALVGPSGGGKTTLGELVSRYYDIESGSIKIGGIDIMDIPNQKLMDMISFVFQDAYIFSDTVLGNITMNKSIPFEEVENACKKAMCHDFIQRLPDGYNTKLGDGGYVLSGGELQRIAIARAMTKNAPILVLDEALSFADAENEANIILGIKELIKNKTVLIIAHRLYSIQNAEKIIAIDKGRIAEEGTHDSLISRNGLYKRLWDIQSSTKEWSIGGVVQ